LPNPGQVSNYFFDVCRNLGKAQIYFLMFVGTSARLKFIFCRLPEPRQVPNLFFGICPSLGKSQIYFLMFAGTSASPKFIFLRLPEPRQVLLLQKERVPAFRHPLSSIVLK